MPPRSGMATRARSFCASRSQISARQRSVRRCSRCFTHARTNRNTKRSGATRRGRARSSTRRSSANASPTMAVPRISSSRRTSRISDACRPRFANRTNSCGVCRPGAGRGAKRTARASPASCTTSWVRHWRGSRSTCIGSDSTSSRITVPTTFARRSMRQCASWTTRSGGCGACPASSGRRSSTSSDWWPPSSGKRRSSSVVRASARACS